MQKYTYQQIIKTAKQGNEQEWDACVRFLHTNEPNSDEMAGLYEFLNRNDFSREKLLCFIASIENQQIEQKALPLVKKIPAWIPFLAASILLVSVVLVNKTLHDAKIHIAAQPLPVYMDAESNLVFNKAMASYKKGDYQTAKTNFMQLKSDTAMFYAGVCAQMTNDFNGAVVRFASINRNSVYVNTARLRMAACLIGLGKDDEARMILENFNSSNKDEADFANQLRLKLN